MQVAAVLFQSSGFHWNLMAMWESMEWPARSIALVLLLMSAWSIGVMIDRWLSAARKQSRQFAPAVGGALREGKLEEAIRVAERSKRAIWREL
jgi:biopolymer transport protein ExbB